MRAPTPFTRRTFLGTLTAAGGGLALAGLPGLPASAAERRGWHRVADDVRSELRHTWQAYRQYAWGHDQLLPVSGGHSEFFDDAHPVGLSIVEALGTLYFMGLDDELADGVAWVKNNLDFRAVNADVQVFETNIRMVGGLLSGYLCTGERALLDNAREIADILLPCFTTSPTGLPYRRVNPSTGEITGNINVLAEIGTIVAEFGTLSRLVHDDKYFNAAKKAQRAVFDRRSDLDLVGTEINIETGVWTDSSSRVDPPVDSFFEYLWDGWDLFHDREIKHWYDTLTAAVLRHEAERYGGSLWFQRVDMETGASLGRETSELTSYYAGLLGQSGHLREGEAYHSAWASVLKTYALLPEGYDYGTGKATDPGNQLRPEYVDAAFNLWLVTGKELYRERAYDYYLRQKRASRVANGWTIVTDVTTSPAKVGDLTSGYWWAEQMKYWYLLFADCPRFDYRNNYLSTEGAVLRGVIRH
ncbi:MAG: glycoside hydrolase family 47 protein [Actinoallomurus sp.]